MAEVTGLRNNALPYPVYGAPWGVVFPMLDADGDLVTGATTPDAERSLNGDTFADCTNESTEIATNSGMYYLLLTAAELTADVVTVIAKSATAGMKTTPIVMYPRKLVTLRSGTVGANAADGTTIQLDSSAVAVDDYYNGCLVVATIDSVVEARIIGDYVGSTKVCTVAGPAFNTAPDNNDTFVVYLPEGRQVSEANATAWNGTAVSTPATAGIPDVNVKNIDNDAASASGTVTFPNATLASTANITAGTITTVTNLTNAPSAGDLTATMKTSVQTAADAALVALNLDHLLAVAVPTNFQGAVHDNSVIGHITTIADANTFDRTTDSLEAFETNALTEADIADQVWDEAVADHQSAGSTGEALEDAGGAGTPPTAAAIADAVWDEDATAHQTQGTFGQAIGDPVADANTIFKATVTDATAATVGLDVVDLKTQIGTAGAGLTAADDAVLAAIAALNNLSQANIRTAVGLATANLDTQLDALPTNAELATALGTADDAVLAAIAALNNLSAAQVATALANYAAVQPAEAYAAAGVVPTRDQFLFMIYALLANFAYTGTTQSVKKVDGTTQAMTFELDSAVTPTEHLRT